MGAGGKIVLNARCIRAVSDNVFMAQSFASNIGFDVRLTVSITSFECCETPSYLSLRAVDAVVVGRAGALHHTAYTSMHSTHRAVQHATHIFQYYYCSILGQKVKRRHIF